MRAIAARPGLLQRELAEVLGITAQGAGKIIDANVRGRFVRRVADPVDSRAWRLYLGARGEQLLEAARAFHQQFEAELRAAHPRDADATRRTLEAIVGSASEATSRGRLRPM